MSIISLAVMVFGTALSLMLFVGLLAALSLMIFVALQNG